MTLKMKVKLNDEEKCFCAIRLEMLAFHLEIFPEY